MLLSIYDGGSMGTGGLVTYLGHPVDVDAEDSEGSAPTYDIDTAASVPVVVLGNTPSVRDLLTAFSVGGKWVAERGGSQPNCCVLQCLPCAIPKKDLTLAWTNGITGDGTTTLAYNGTSWATGCVNGLQFLLGCVDGTAVFTASYWTSGACPDGGSQNCNSGATAPRKLVLSASTCNPLSLTYTSTSANCTALTAAGYTQFVVSDSNPIPPSELMCQTFSPGISGVTATVYASMGGAVVASGTTGSSGSIYLTWRGASGNYYVTYSNASGDTPTGCTLKLVACGTVFGVAVNTQTCGCVAPGKITITVQQGSSTGPVVASATANSAGQAAFLVCTSGLYYYSSSTTASGYSSSVLTMMTAAAPGRTTVSIFLVPTTLTATIYGASVTLRPFLGDPFTNPDGGPGNICADTSSPNIYLGDPTTATIPASDVCPATDVALQVAFALCGSFGSATPVLSVCYLCCNGVCPGTDCDTPITCGGGFPMPPALNTPTMCYPLNLSNPDAGATVTQ